MIKRFAVTWHPNGFDSARIDDRLPSGLLDAVCCGDALLVIADMPAKAKERALRAFQMVNKKNPTASFYFCDMGDSWRSRKFEARLKSQAGHSI